MSKIITATLHDMTPVPTGSIYRGNGMLEFETKEEPETVSDKLAEYDTVKRTYYKDASLKIELTADALVAEAEKTEVIEKTDFIIEKLDSGDFEVKK